MPRPDRARAELAAIQRAALYPERHVIEGAVVALDDGATVEIDNGLDGTQLLTVLGGLIGRRVRIVIEVLPPEGDAGRDDDTDPPIVAPAVPSRAVTVRIVGRERVVSARYEEGPTDGR